MSGLQHPTLGVYGLWQSTTISQYIQRSLVSNAVDRCLLLCKLKSSRVTWNKSYSKLKSSKGLGRRWEVLFHRSPVAVWPFQIQSIPDPESPLTGFQVYTCLFFFFQFGCSFPIVLHIFKGFDADSSSTCNPSVAQEMEGKIVPNPAVQRFLPFQTPSKKYAVNYILPLQSRKNALSDNQPQYGCKQASNCI